MSCVLTGILKDCDKNLGGVKRLFLVSFWGVDSLSYTELNKKKGLASINFKAGHSFVEYEGAFNSTSYNVTGSEVGNRVNEFNHSISFRINKRTLINHEELYNLLSGGNRLMALLQDGNGRWWLFGQTTGLSSSIGGGSGIAKSDGSSYQITLSGKQDFFEISVNETLALTLIDELPITGLSYYESGYIENGYFETV
jgi:hypothetical protein